LAEVVEQIGEQMEINITVVESEIAEIGGDFLEVRNPSRICYS
jgi:hypothetical protein